MISYSGECLFGRSVYSREHSYWDIGHTGVPVEEDVQIVGGIHHMYVSRRTDSTVDE